MSSRRAGLSRSSAGASPTRSARPSASTSGRRSNGASASANTNTSRANASSRGAAQQDRFSSQRERARLRRAVDEEEDQDSDDGENQSQESADEAAADVPLDHNAGQEQDDDAGLPIEYRVPKITPLPISESVRALLKSMGRQEAERRVNELVRLALFSEFRRQPIRREDITKKVLDKATSRAFPYVFSRAQSILRSTFCYEMVAVRARGVENEHLAAQAKETQKDKKRSKEAATQGKGKRKPADDDDDDDDDTEQGGSRGSAKAWVLRSILPSVMITALAEPNARIAAAFEDEGQDDQHQHRAGPSSQPSGMMMNWNRADGQLGNMGLTFLILGFILLNGRGLPNDQLYNHLYRLGLDIHNDLPASLRPYNVLADDHSLPDSSSHPTTLKTCLALLVRQGYLEQGELNPPGVVGRGGGGGGGGDKPAGGRRRKSARAADANDENAARAEDNIEWKWGPRAEAEIGEKAVAEFITDVYVMGGPEDDDDEGGEEQEPAAAQSTPVATQRRGGRYSSFSTQQQRTPFTQTQNLSATQRQRRAQASQSLRKDIERAAGSQLVN